MLNPNTLTMDFTKAIENNMNLLSEAMQSLSVELLIREFKTMSQNKITEMTHYKEAIEDNMYHYKEAIEDNMYHYKEAIEDNMSVYTKAFEDNMSQFREAIQESSFQLMVKDFVSTHQMDFKSNINLLGIFMVLLGFMIVAYYGSRQYDRALRKRLQVEDSIEYLFPEYREMFKIDFF